MLTLFGEAFGYSMSEGVYKLIAHVYDWILSIINNAEFINTIGGVDTATITQNLYVFVGIFMLFRIAISFLSIILEPDKFSGSDNSPGKIMNRVVITIILLIVFMPGSFFYEDIIVRINNALVGEDGLIVEIFQNQNLSSVNNNVENKKEFATNNLLYTNVMASGYKPLDCYYLKIEDGKTTGAVHMKIVSKEDADDSYTIPIHYKQIKRYYLVGDLIDTGFTEETDIAYKFVEGSYKDPEVDGGHSLQFLTPTYNKTFLDNDNMVWIDNENKTLSCPGGLNVETSEGSSEFTTGTTTSQLHLLGEFENNIYYSEVFTSLEELESKTLDYAELAKYKNGTDFDNIEAIEFSKTLFTAFIDCNPDENGSRCELSKDTVFTYSDDDNNGIIEVIEDGDAEFDFFISLLFGLVVVIVLFVLYIDVIVRQLKLTLLKIIAPMAIIMYIDSKSKIFNEWLKMFVATFVDIYIKIFALIFASKFIGDINWEDSIFKNFALLIAILVFAKAIPTMISKITGLDVMGGTFKDSFNMLKKGVGLAGGAAATGLVGLGTGAMAFANQKGNRGQKALSFGKDVLGGGAKGALSGAASGVKGKPFGAIKDISSKNASKTMKYRSGLTTTGDISMNAFGGYFSQANRYARKVAKYETENKAFEPILKNRKKLKDDGENTNLFKDLKNKNVGRMNNGQPPILEEGDMDGFAKAQAQAIYVHTLDSYTKFLNGGAKKRIVGYDKEGNKIEKNTSTNREVLKELYGNLTDEELIGKVENNNFNTELKQIIPSQAQAILNSKSYQELDYYDEDSDTVDEKQKGRAYREFKEKMKNAKPGSIEEYNAVQDFTKQVKEINEYNERKINETKTIEQVLTQNTK